MLACYMTHHFHHDAACRGLRALGSVAEPAVLKRLEPTKDLRSAQVRRQACDILSDIGTAKSVPALQGVAKNDPEQSVRRAAELALQGIEKRKGQDKKEK